MSNKIQERPSSSVIVRKAYRIWRYKYCPRCRGDMFLVNDIFESYWECLQCSCHSGIIQHDDGHSGGFK